MPTELDAARFFLIFLRVSAFVTFAPPFGGRDVPVVARVGFAGLTAFLLAAWVPSPGVFPTDPVGWGLAVAMELAVGLALAGFWSLFLGGIQMGAHLVAAQLGFGWGGLFDPTVGDSAEALVLFQRMTVLLIFFAVDGHLRLMELLTRSVQWAPVGEAVFRAAAFELWSRAFADMFVTGFKLAAPVTAAIWILTLALGLVGRAAPAMNLLSLDFPLRTALGFVTLAVCAPHLTRLSEKLLAQFFQRADVFARCFAP